MANTGKGDDDWVRLVSNDGHTFLVKRKVATASGTLKSMLSTEGSFAEAASNTCSIQERAIVVEKLCEYLQYKSTYESVSAKEDIPDFTERVPPEIVLELLLAADYFESNLMGEAKYCISQAIPDAGDYGTLGDDIVNACRSAFCYRSRAPASQRERYSGAMM